MHLPCHNHLPTPSRTGQVSGRVWVFGGVCSHSLWCGTRGSECPFRVPGPEGAERFYGELRELGGGRVSGQYRGLVEMFGDMANNYFTGSTMSMFGKPTISGDVFLAGKRQGYFAIGIDKNGNPTASPY